jgi:hypothetical protein
MKWLKKVAATPLTSIARVVDSLQVQTNDKTNAPSIHAVNEAIKSNWFSIYPIGSIYMSLNNVDPSTIFGGTWQQIKDKFLLASGDVFTNGETGGEISHTLSVSEMPAHTHNVVGNAFPIGSSRIALNDESIIVTEGTGGSTIGVSRITGGTTGLDVEGTAQSAGSGVAHNNMPPYLAVNVWVRTA